MKVGPPDQQTLKSVTLRPTGVSSSARVGDGLSTHFSPELSRTDANPVDRVGLPTRVVPSPPNPAELALADARTALRATLPALPCPASVALATLPDGTLRPYPKAQKGDTVDVYHGVKVADPYRPLEKMDSSETRGWVTQENRLTRDFLGRIPGRDKIEAAVANARPSDIRSLPTVVGDRMYYTKSTDHDQSEICVSNLDGQDEKVVFDPNPLSDQGLVAVNGFQVSPDGKKMAYGLMSKGTDWVEWRVRDLEKGTDLPGAVRSTKYGDNLTWTDDSQGFYYPHFERPPDDQALTAPDKSDGFYFHKAGSSQAQDQIAGTAGLPAQPVGGDLSDSDGNIWHKLAKDGDTSYYLVKGDGVGKGCLRAVDGEAFDTSRVVLPEGADTLQGAVVVNGQLVANYLQDGHSRLERFDAQGNSKGAIPLPGLGAVTDLRSLKDGRMLFDFSGPTYPPTVFRYRSDTDKTDVLWQAKTNYDPAASTWAACSSTPAYGVVASMGSTGTRTASC